MLSKSLAVRAGPDGVVVSVVAVAAVAWCGAGFSRSKAPDESQRPVAESIAVGSAISCDRCFVQVRRAVTFEMAPAADTSSAAGLVFRVQAGPQGGTISTSLLHRGWLDIRSRDGTLLSSFPVAHDSQGGRPVASAFALGPGDTVYVLDAFGELRAFAPGGWRLVRRIHTAVSNSALNSSAFAGGRLVLAGVVRTRSGAGLPLHAIDVRTGTVHSFGPQDDPTENWRAASALNFHSVFSSSGARVWTWPSRRYDLTRYTPDGAVDMVLLRSADFFGDLHLEDVSQGLRADRPPPRIPLAVIERDDGLIVTVAGLPTRDWRRAFVVAEPGHGGEHPFDSYFPLYSSVVDVLDPETGRLMARSRIPVWIRGAAGNRLWSLERSDRGTPRVVLWDIVYSNSTRRAQ